MLASANIEDLGVEADPKFIALGNEPIVVDPILYDVLDVMLPEIRETWREWDGERLAALVPVSHLVFESRFVERGFPWLNDQDLGTDRKAIIGALGDLAGKLGEHEDRHGSRVMFAWDG